MTLSIAGVLALGTGLLTFNYLGSLNHANATADAPKPVIVARHDIPARSTLTLDMFDRVMRPSSTIEPDAVTNPSKLAGSISLITIPANSTVTNSKIGRPTDVGLPVRMRVGTRAVSIPIDRVKGVAGLVQPGDHVDVIAVVSAHQNDEPHAYAILRDVTVLAMGNAMETAAATPGPDAQNFTTVTLQVTPKQADLLALADVNTVLRLALRSPKEPARSEVSESLHFPSQQPMRLAMPAPAAAPVAPAAAPIAPQPAAATPAARVPAPIHIVRDPSPQIIDGDHVVAGGSADRNSNDVAGR